MSHVNPSSIIFSRDVDPVPIKNTQDHADMPPDCLFLLHYHHKMSVPWLDSGCKQTVDPGWHHCITATKWQTPAAGCLQATHSENCHLVAHVFVNKLFRDAGWCQSPKMVIITYLVNDVTQDSGPSFFQTIYIAEVGLKVQLRLQVQLGLYKQFPLRLLV